MLSLITGDIMRKILIAFSIVLLSTTTSQACWIYDFECRLREDNIRQQQFQYQQQMQQMQYQQQQMIELQRQQNQMMQQQMNSAPQYYSQPIYQPYKTY